VKHTHIIKLPQRTGTLVVEELPSVVAMWLRFSKVGNFGDTQQLKDLLLPIFQDYEKTNKPISMMDSHTGQIVLVISNDKPHTTVTK
jgi:hypothetical protein